MLISDPLSPRQPAILRGTRAFIGGGSSSPAPQRNLTTELNQTLAGYQQTSPGFLALNQQYQPLYTNLGLGTEQTTQQGYTDSSGVYHPGTTALGQTAATSNRGSTLSDLNLFGPSTTGSLFNSNPFLANSTVNSSNLLSQLTGQAQQQLALNGALSPSAARDASQATQAGFAARGIDNGNSSLITDVLNRDALTRQRQLAAQSFAGNVAGQNLTGANTYSSTITNPVLQTLGFGNLNPGYSSGAPSATGAAVSTANSLFPTMSPYLSDLYSSNQNATTFNNQSAANNQAAQTNAYIGLIGSLFSDERLKKKIKTVGKTPSGVPVKTYIYKHDPKQRTFVGGMAQEIERVFPKAVITDPISGLKAVKYRETDVPFGLVEQLMAA